MGREKNSVAPSPVRPSTSKGSEEGKLQRMLSCRFFGGVLCCVCGVGVGLIVWSIRRRRRRPMHTDTFTTHTNPHDPKTHQRPVERVHVPKAGDGQVHDEGADGRDADDEFHPVARRAHERLVHGEDVEGAVVFWFYGVSCVCVWDKGLIDYMNGVRVRGFGCMVVFWVGTCGSCVMRNIRYPRPIPFPPPTNIPIKRTT